MKIAGSGFRIQDPDPRSISQRHGSEDPPDPDPPQNVMDPQHCYLILWCGSGTSLSLWCGSGSWFSFDGDPDPDFHLTWMRIRLFTWYGSGSYFFLQSWIRPKWFSNLSLWLDMDPWHFGKNITWERISSSLMDSHSSCMCHMTGQCRTGNGVFCRPHVSWKFRVT